MSTEEQLKAENARLKADAQVILKHLDEASADCARLKADVNELAAGLKLASEVGIKVADEVTRLKAEVERLRKAGDELAWAFSFAVSRHDGEPSGLVKAWNAAKGGKPSV